MGVSDTSVEAYREEQGSGRSWTRREQVKQAIKGSCGVTRAQIASMTGISLQSVCGRVHELVKGGEVYEDGCVVDPVTNKRVYVLKVVRFEKQLSLVDGS